MQIIFSREVAEQLKEKYIVLELETVTAPNGQVIEAHCVVPADKIPIMQLPDLDRDREFHNKFVEAIKRKDYRLCADMAPYLIGKFGGELDSFYEVVAGRYQTQE